MRYVSASEAHWKLRGSQLHYKNIAVVKLPCHLENEQLVLIPQGVDQQQILPPVTKLTAFFDLNKHDDLAKNILYIDIPKYFTWKMGSKETPPLWKRRERGVTDETSDFTSNAIGRINRITFNAHQCIFYECHYIIRKDPHVTRISKLLI